MTNSSSKCSTASLAFERTPPFKSKAPTPRLEVGAAVRLRNTFRTGLMTRRHYGDGLINPKFAMLHLISRRAFVYSESR